MNSFVGTSIGIEDSLFFYVEKTPIEREVEEKNSLELNMLHCSGFNSGLSSFALQMLSRPVCLALHVQSSSQRKLSVTGNCLLSVSRQSRELSTRLQN